MPKRTQESSSDYSSDDEPDVKASSSKVLVHPNRVLPLKKGVVGKGPVIYWMSRDQRMKDNWALIYAAEQAAKTGSPVAVPAFLGAGARHFGFMLRGLQEIAPRLEAHGVKFFMLRGDPADTLPELVSSTGAALLLTDYSPLRLGRKWRDEVKEKLSIPFFEVDAHNVVPVWVASDKREIGARTLRPKIHKQLPTFMKEFPELPAVAQWSSELPQPDKIDWDELIKEVTTKGAAVPEVTWCIPGADAAEKALADFLSPARLSRYADKRNDPCARALSNLSPYFHYGQIAPQRAALEAAKLKPKFKEAVESFLEEMVVRRELSDNFCEYTPNYDSLECAAEWAKESLRIHTADKREYIYTKAEFEKGKTHDELWNAAQLELVHAGKMHGFMRMYWAKKILEWTNCADDAIEIGIYLNDKFSLDGRDPSGYVGVMWSMCGIHDMGWTERAVFGKIRYMNYAGCKRKFNIPGYVSYVDKIVRDTQAGKNPFSGPPPPDPPPKAKRGGGAKKAAPAAAKPKASATPAWAKPKPTTAAPKVDLAEFDDLFGDDDGGGEVVKRNHGLKP
eukprot:gene18200-24642_t